MSQFTREEKRACIDREIRMRQRVYPRWVEQERMSQMKADTEIRLMMEIAKDYAEEDLFQNGN